MLKMIMSTIFVLALAGCETIALLGSAGADDPPPVQEKTVKTASVVALPLPQPVRSSQPLTAFEIEQKAYAGEDQDHGTPPFTSLIPDAYRARTPHILPGATLVNTYEMHQLLLQEKRPLLINVLGGERSENIAGSVWLSGAGVYERMDDTVQIQLANHLKTLTNDDKQRALVFYCLDVDCWLSFNAGLRAIALGYRNVHWYRGGLRSWYAAGLPTTPTEKDLW